MKAEAGIKFTKLDLETKMLLSLHRHYSSWVWQITQSLYLEQEFW
jgi:hypothetical protein